MKFILLFLLFTSLGPSQSWGAAEIINVFGVSRFDTTTSTTTPTIYGGVGGTCGSTNSVDTCDSCNSGELKVCNQARIYSNLILEIQFKDTDTAGKTAVTTSNDIPIPLQTGSTNTSTIAIGNTHIALIRWSDLCSALKDGSNCEDATVSGIIKIGVDTSDDLKINGTAQNISVKVVLPDPAADVADINCDTAQRGICNFFAYPGDKKIFLEEVKARGNFPNDSNTQFKFVRVIYSDVSYEESVLNPKDAITAGNFKDLSIEPGDTTTEPDLASITVDGLTNNQIYFFRVMLLDEANNITDITPTIAYTGDANCNGDAATAPADETEFDCAVTAIPDEVLGLLTEDLNCFISTAAYGSSFSKKVETFRQFRRKFMLPNKFGRQLNLWYYQFGSKASLYLVKNKFLKKLARVVLYPFWAFANASLNYGLFNALSLLFLSGLSAFLVLIFSFRSFSGWIKIRRKGLHL